MTVKNRMKKASIKGENLHHREIKRILVVDNDNLVLSFMDDLLKREGYDVMTAQDGLGALDMLKAHAAPHAIFLDLVMPGIDGKTLCRIIRKMERFKDVHITILSATLADERINITELGANACIAKGPLGEMGRHVLFVLREPEAASSRCSLGEILGIENVYPRTLVSELLSQKEHFARIMGKIPQGFMELNREGLILFANPSALTLVSIPEEELVGFPFSDLFEGDERLHVEELFYPSTPQTRNIAFEAPVNLNGRLLSLEMVPHMDGEASFSVIMTDVTEHRREMDVFRGRERQLTQVIFDNSDAMIVADGEGVVRLVNPAAEALFGRESRTLVGSIFGFPLAGDETAEVDVITRNGDTRMVEMRVVETAWDGKPAYLASIRDITERTEMERALEDSKRKILEQQEKLVEEERLKVLLQMAGATAHELNQPLTALLGNVELLEMGTDDPKLLAECLRDIKTSGKRIADTVKKIQNIRFHETKPYAKKGFIIDIDQDINILSIEDSDRYFETIEAVFDGMDHVGLMRAKTIESALPILAAGKIDLVLLEYVLPDGTGFDFMKQALEMGIDTPVVILTGNGDEMIAARMIREGASDYLSKAAFSRDSIFRIILNVLEQARLKKEIRLAREKMARMAARDVLTGLHNRRYLFEALEREKARSDRHSRNLTVCMIDLDHFKRINDTHGHPAGDRVLSEIGKLLLRWARETDLPCRYGGEEFAVVLPETNLEGARIACERLRRMVAEHGFEYEDLTLKVTISIGIAFYDNTTKETVSELINKADKALYRAKKEGRNRVVG